MRRITIAGATLLCVLVGLVYAQESNSPVALQDEAGDKQAAGETLIYPVRSTPARELSAALAHFFGDSELRITAEPTSNLLLIRGPDPETRNEILKVLDRLDRPPRTLFIQLYHLKSRGEEQAEVDASALSGPQEDVLQRISDWESDGRLYVATRMELTAVENQRSVLQVGEQVAVVTGATQSPRGRSNTYQNRQVGTILSVMANASDDGRINLQLQFEQSSIDEPDKQDPQDEDTGPVPRATSTLTQQTTVQLRDGHAVHAGTMVSRSSRQTDESYLVVAASVRDEKKDGQATSFRTFSRSGAIATRRTSPLRSRGAPGRDERGARAAAPTLRERSTNDLKSRYERYATQLVKRYDQDGDVGLTSAERAQMPTDYSAADTNEDGIVTVKELVQHLMKR